MRSFDLNVGGRGLRAALFSLTPVLTRRRANVSAGPWSRGVSRPGAALTDGEIFTLIDKELGSA